MCLCRFDGLAVIHKFQISEGGITYRNQHLVKDMENYILANNRPPSLPIYNDPCSSYLGRAFSTFYQAGIVTKLLHAFMTCLPEVVAAVVQ